MFDILWNMFVVSLPDEKTDIALLREKTGVSVLTWLLI